MNRIALAFVVIVTALALTSGAALADDYGKQKAVYHVNGGDEKQNIAALRNMQNHINAVGAENIEIKVVMHSGGVQLLARALENEDIRSRVDSLKTQGVEFQVCANTLRGKGIDRENDLYEVAESDIVPSGVAHLAHLQGQGYTYIKP